MRVAIRRGALALLLVLGDGAAQDVADPALTMGSPNQPTATDGECEIEVRLQAEGEDPPVGVPVDWHPDGNIIVKLAGDACQVGVSPTWTVAGWDYTAVQIAPDATFEPPAVLDDERQLVKLMRGTLVDVNVNGIFTGGHWETHVVTAPNRPISMYVDNSVDAIKAGSDGAVIWYIKVPERILSTPITDMKSSPATDVAGPFSDNLEWVQYGTYFPDPFEGVEFYNLAGILLQESDGGRLGYVQFWTFREDQNADGYHDHSNLSSENAFGEIHMAMYAATGVSGMQTTLPNTKNLNYQANPKDTSGTGNSYFQNDQTEVQIAIPMPPGFAHGPLWSVDPDTGAPTLLCSGGIKYPFHRWLIQANGVPNDPLRYSMWVAFEHLPEDVHVPLKMITEWPNAYLQSTMEGCEGEGGDVAADPAADPVGNVTAADPGGNATSTEGGSEDPASEPSRGSVCSTGWTVFAAGSLAMAWAFVV